MTWRRKWARNWEQVRYCSEACRARGRTASDEQLEAAIRAAVRGRRSVSDTDIDRPPGVEVEAVRRAARRLVASNDVELVQDGRVVDPSTARGSFRIRATGR